MAKYIPPVQPTDVPSPGGLSATIIMQIGIGIGIAFIPVMICCVCSSTWVTSKLRRRPREEDVVEEEVFDDMGQAILFRRQRSELEMPTYKEVKLEEGNGDGRWMEVQVSFGFTSTGGQPWDLQCTKHSSPLLLHLEW
jgi:hypothetical protein